jgi:hypothetical protein
MPRHLSRSSTPPSPPRAALRLVAAFLLAGFVLPGFWHALHSLAVPHFECPYDGALVHEDELPEEARGARSAAASNEPGTAVVPHHDHGNCRESCWSQRPAAFFSFSRALIATVLWLQRAEPVPALPAIVREVLSYAPKLPPPGQAVRA